MIAAEAKYHAACLLSLYRRAAQVQTPDTTADDLVDVQIPDTESLALAEVIAYIEESNKKTTENKGAFTKVVWAYGKGLIMSSSTQTKMVLFWWK